MHVGSPEVRVAPEASGIGVSSRSRLNRSTRSRPIRCHSSLSSLCFLAGGLAGSSAGGCGSVAPGVFIPDSETPQKTFDYQGPGSAMFLHSRLFPATWNAELRTIKLAIFLRATTAAERKNAVSIVIEDDSPDIVSSSGAQNPVVKKEESNVAAEISPAVPAAETARPRNS
eukprot:4933689-Prymnesium_polylepis.1